MGYALGAGMLYLPTMAARKPAQNVEKKKKQAHVNVGLLTKHDASAPTADGHCQNNTPKKHALIVWREVNVSELSGKSQAGAYHAAQNSTLSELLVLHAAKE